MNLKMIRRSRTRKVGRRRARNKERQHAWPDIQRLSKEDYNSFRGEVHTAFPDHCIFFLVGKYSRGDNKCDRPHTIPEGYTLQSRTRSTASEGAIALAPSSSPRSKADAWLLNFETASAQVQLPDTIKAPEGGSSTLQEPGDSDESVYDLLCTDLPLHTRERLNRA